MRDAMNIVRIYDAAPANEILNHPTIKAQVAGSYEGYIDIKPIIENEDNVVLQHPLGVAMFVKLQTGYYDMHVAVLPEGRGDWVRDASAFCFRHIFTHTDAIEIITRCPSSNPAAVIAATNAHMTYEFTTGDIVDIYTLGINKWVNSDPDIFLEGEWLHRRYDEEFKRLGSDTPRHAEDATHNRYAGAAVAMMRAGQMRKAIGFYNRYALLAGYSPLEVTKLDPVEITVDGFTMRITNNDFEIVKCPQSQE